MIPGRFEPGIEVIQKKFCTKCLRRDPNPGYKPSELKFILNTIINVKNVIVAG
jgi:hypothetical protein